MKLRKAFTLIEVLAALAILSSALIVLLTAQQRSLRMLRAQEARVIADDLARELISDWKLRPNHQPADRGQFNPTWHWTRKLEDVAEADSKLVRVTLSILHTDELRQTDLIASYEWLESRNVR